MKRILRRFSLLAGPLAGLLAGLLLGTPCALALDLSAGPLIGHVTDNSARLWMQFPIAGKVNVNVFDVQQMGREPVTSIQVDLEGPTPFVCDLPLNNLEPGRTYRVEVKFEGKPINLPPITIHTAPVPGSQVPFTIGFGSDLALSPMPTLPHPASGVPANATAPAGAAPAPLPTPLLTDAPPPPPKRDMPIFRAITGLQPQAFLFLGDVGHLPPTIDDFPIKHRAAPRFFSDFHSAIRREPDLQLLFRTTPCYAIYNDRDFGTLNADADFVFADESIVAFSRFWPNPDWGTPANPGCFCTFTYADVDFFLLDCRNFRDPLIPAPVPAPAPTPDETAKPGPKAMLGAAQLSWLEKHLKTSTARFKILAAPDALFGDDPAHADPNAWSRYPEEQKAFLDFLSANAISGVIALAGNQPAAQLTRIQFNPQSHGALIYPLFTLGCSTLAGVPNAPINAAPPNINRVGQPVSGDTFGTLDFGGDRDHRFVTLRLHDDTGKTRLEQTLFAGQLAADGSH